MSLLCITVVVLVIAVYFGVYLQSESQLATKQQDNELVQQKIQLEDDNKQLKSTNKQLDDDNKLYKSILKQLDDDNKQLKTTNKQLDDDNKQLNTTNKQLDDDNKQLKMKNKLLVDNTEHLKSLNASNISYEHIAPVIITMNNFTEKMKNKQQWYSDPFFAFWRGYKMCLNVDAGGQGDGDGTHVSVFLYLMNGPYDDRLEQSGDWPLRGRFKVELLDQVNDGKDTHFITIDGDVPSKSTDRVSERDMVPTGWGNHKLIPHGNTLNSNYLKHDSLYFMISYQPFGVSQQSDEYVVAPVIFKMNNFTEKMKNKQLWYSDPFFAFWRGYKMCLRVNAGGSGDGEGTHVSVYLYLMNGPYDDRLEQSDDWPLRGRFKVELLDQVNDGKDTHFITFYSDVPSKSTDRVSERDTTPTGWGNHKLIPHGNILNSNYLKHDSLYFMISYQSFSESQQNDKSVAPVIFKMNNFTEKMKNKQQWYSDPFFAFWRGYKMCLNVDAGGHGDGDGTHVSVFLYLMNGPYDDRLEQSGDWPLRGRFKIELLDQINDNNYANDITFDGNRDRVKEPDISTGYGKTQFMSHKTILHSNYLQHDSLYFMISYSPNGTAKLSTANVILVYCLTVILLIC